MSIRRSQRPAGPGSSAVLLLAAGSVGLLDGRLWAVPAEQPRPDGPIKLKVAYIGLTCEAPIFVAQEKGFFKDEGLDVELVKTDWVGLQPGLSTGKFDANHTLLMYLLQGGRKGPRRENHRRRPHGLPAHPGRRQHGHQKVEDLKGKTIGVPAPFGSPPHMFAAARPGRPRHRPRQDSPDVHWKAIQGGALEQALKNGEVQAVADAEPLGTRFIGDGVVKPDAVADQAARRAVQGRILLRAGRQRAAGAGQPGGRGQGDAGLLKGAKWVSENQKAASELSVEKQFVPSSPNIKEINTQALLKLDYTPGVKKCRKSLDEAAADMKRAGLLQAETDPKALAKKAWLDLDGVTDEWVNGLKVEKTAAGPAGLAQPGGVRRPVRRPEVVLRRLLLRRRMTGRRRPNGRMPCPRTFSPKARPSRRGRKPSRRPPGPAVSAARAAAAAGCRRPSRP